MNGYKLFALCYAVILIFVALMAVFTLDNLFQQFLIAVLAISFSGLTYAIVSLSKD